MPSDTPLCLGSLGPRLPVTPHEWARARHPSRPHFRAPPRPSVVTGWGAGHNAKGPATKGHVTLGGSAAQPWPALHPEQQSGTWLASCLHHPGQATERPLLYTLLPRSDVLPTWQVLSRDGPSSKKPWWVTQRRPDTLPRTDFTL